MFLSVIVMLVFFLASEHCQHRTESAVFACPPDWTPVGSSCYLALTGQYNVIKAISSCKAKDSSASVPVIRNQNDWDELTKWYNQQKLNKDWDIWMNGQDTQREGSFKTFADENGDSCAIRYENWSPGRPQNNTSANCIVIHHKNDTNTFAMNDISCTLAWPQVVCQIPMFQKCDTGFFCDVAKRICKSCSGYPDTCPSDLNSRFFTLEECSKRCKGGAFFCDTVLKDCRSCSDSLQSCLQSSVPVYTSSQECQTNCQEPDLNVLWRCNTENQKCEQCVEEGPATGFTRICELGEVTHDSRSECLAATSCL